MKDLAKNVKENLSPILEGDEEPHKATGDRLPTSVVTETINTIFERVNHGFQDIPELSSPDSTSSQEKNIEDTDMPDKVVQVSEVPENLKLWRWELNASVKESIYKALPEDISRKLDSRLDERLAAREAAKLLFATLEEGERRDILSKKRVGIGRSQEEKVENERSLKKPVGKGKTKVVLEEDEDEGLGVEDKGEGSSKGKVISTVSLNSADMGN